MMLELARGLADLLWPRACASCQRISRTLLCDACERGLPWLPPDACALCQTRPRRRAGERCAPCSARRRPLRACIAGADFEGDAAAWIRAFKYASPWRVELSARSRARIRALAQAAASRVPGPPPLGIVPMPLHPRRLRKRGFNPALVIARELARSTDAPIAHALVRTRDTPSQTGLDRRARRRNVARAFAERGAIPQRVWLADDVVTTGATLEAAARTLRRAGAKEVIGVCLARTPDPERSLRAEPTSGSCPR